MFFSRVYSLTFALVLFTFPVTSQTFLESGKPIKAASVQEGSRFALPSVNGFIMGGAKIGDDQNPGLMMYGDKYNPGTYFHPLDGVSRENIPIFGKPARIQTPLEANGQRRAVVMQSDASLYGYWADGKELVVSQFDKSSDSFKDGKRIKVNNLPGNIFYFGALRLAPEEYLFVFTVGDTTVNPKYPKPSNEPGKRHMYEAYDQGRFWQMQIPRSGIYGAFISSATPNELNPFPLTDLKESLYSLESYAVYTHNKRQYLIGGTTLGNIHTYLIDKENRKLSSAGFLKDIKGQMLRHPAIHQYMAIFDSGNVKGIISSGEGGIWFYPDESKRAAKDELAFGQPVHLLQKSGDLYGGSLVVPNLVDWDHDGDLDIISGNSMGQIQFFQNVGTNKRPEFANPEDLQAGGYRIHVQPGYNQSVQGPVESRWGYVCPTVHDWTGDGLPDILTGDSRSKYNIYINKGQKGKPSLVPEHPLYADGLDVFGTWRVKPGVAKLGDRNAYVILDDDDELRLYWQLDHYNLEDGGKLMIGDTLPIRANFRGGGEAGRSKIHMVDWDLDGLTDLLIGTPRYSTIPEPKKGMPYRLKNNGAAVLFLRNTGSNERPVFEYPVPVRFRGKRINLGQHACSPTTGYIGESGTLNLIVGDETGRFYFYDRKDLQWDPNKED